MIPAWYDLNRQRSYPLVESATLLPYDTLVDAGVLMLPQSEFVVGTHKVWLNRIARDDPNYTLEFRTDAPLLDRLSLVFEFTVPNDTAPYTVFKVTINVDGGDDPALLCDTNVATMFLVVGDITKLNELLENGGYLLMTDHNLETTTIESLADSYVSSITVANKDRTLASAPVECPELDYGDRPTYWKVATCLAGQFRFLPGYNVKVQQNDRNNQIQFGIRVRDGDAKPCNELALHVDEPIPSWSLFRDGSVACHQTIRSIGGGSGPNLVISSRQGVAISTVPDENKVIVDVNFSGLIVCPAEIEYV